jgi:hypothetical protein
MVALFVVKALFVATSSHSPAPLPPITIPNVQQLNLRPGSSPIGTWRRDTRPPGWGEPNPADQAVNAPRNRPLAPFALDRRWRIVNPGGGEPAGDAQREPVETPAPYSPESPAE